MLLVIHDNALLRIPQPDEELDEIIRPMSMAI